MKRLQGKSAIVTGASSGMGLATAELFAREGASVALFDMNDATGKMVAERIRSKGFRATFWKVDACNEASVALAIQETKAAFGHIDILINCVGMIGENLPTHQLSESSWDLSMNVNTKSVFFCTKHVIPYLKENSGGSIVNVSSAHGLIATADYPANHASKAAVRMMSKNDALMYAKDKIRINCVLPGYIWTPLLEIVAQKAGRSFAAYKAEIADLQPLGTIGTPEDVAYAILYLASDEAKFLSGSELVVDGGLSNGRIV